MAYHYIGGLIEHAPAHGRRDLPDGQLLQAVRGRRAEFRRHLGPGLRHLRREQPDPDAARPRAAAGWRTAACDGSANPYLAMAVAAGRGPGRHRPRRWTRASRTATTCTCCRPRRSPPAASGPCRRPCCTPPTNSVADDVLRDALGKTPDGDYVDYYAQVKREEFRAWHSGGERLGGRALPHALLEPGPTDDEVLSRNGSKEGAMAAIADTRPENGLVKGTNWWGAFVIGLAGTILVTGIAPYVVQGTGALGIILIGVMTIAGCFLCLCLAELATMWPDRTGGIPAYATESFRPLVGDTAARHIGGVSGWAYWLGWFPVAPINVILTASYLAVLFNFSPGHTDHAGRAPPGAPRSGSRSSLVCFALLLAIFIPAYFGIRLGAAFATVLGVLSMLPLTAMIFLPFFKPGSIHWRNVAGFHAPPHVHVSRRRSSSPGSSRSCGTSSRWRRPPATSASAAAAPGTPRSRSPPRALRDVHLHRDAADVRRRARRRADQRRPADAVPHLHRPHLRARVLGEVVHRDPADPGAGPVGAERHHGLRPVAVPGGRGRPAAALVRSRRTGTACPATRWPSTSCAPRSWCCSARRCGSTSSPTAATCCPARSPSAATSSTGTCARTCSGRSGCRPSPSGSRSLVFVAWTAIYFFGGWNSPKIVLVGPDQGPGSTCSGCSSSPCTRRCTGGGPGRTAGWRRRSPADRVRRPAVTGDGQSPGTPAGRTVTGGRTLGGRAAGAR